MSLPSHSRLYSNNEIVYIYSKDSDDFLNLQVKADHEPHGLTPHALQGKNLHPSSPVIKQVWGNVL